MDVGTAFVYAFLDKVIYFEQSHLFKIELNKVCKLLKVLYRRKQAAHAWYKTLVEFLCKLDFLRIQLDLGIFI